MANRHIERERELHHRMDAVLGEAIPEVELVEVELNEPQQRVVVYIDREGGVGLADCEAVTHAIRDTCPDHELEVSSPGIERPLRHPSHFRDAIGRRVRLRQVDHHRATVVQVMDVEDDAVIVQSDGAQPRRVPFDQVIRCKLVEGDPVGSTAKKDRGRT